MARKKKRVETGSCARRGKEEIGKRKMDKNSGRIGERLLKRGSRPLGIVERISLKEEEDEERRRRGRKRGRRRRRRNK